jgi:NADH-quinone oxidoreductase subunit G
VTSAADVVLPVAAAAERAGSYLNWEGRRREFATTITAGMSGVVISGAGATQATMPECRVLDSLAVEMDADLFTQTPAAAAADLRRLGGYPGNGSVDPQVQVPAPPVPEPGEGKALLATWRRLLDNGSLQDGEPHLAGTARPAVALLSEATAEALGVRLGDNVRVSTGQGSVTLPAEAADLPPGVVWLPGNSGPATVRRSLGAGHGAQVSVTGVPGTSDETSDQSWGDRP